MFNKIFTPKQIEKLTVVGINTWYDLITFLPKKIQTYKVLKTSYNPENGQLYLARVRVGLIEKIGKGYKLTLVDLNGKWQLTAFSFQQNKYIWQKINLTKVAGVVLKYQNSFWSVVEFDFTNQPITDKIEAIYPNFPRYAITDYFWRSIFQKVPKSIFLLDLNGLVPDSSLIPKQIDMAKIHFPKSASDYYLCYKQFLSLKIFLKLAIIKAKDKQNTSMAPNIELDLDLLKSMSDSLPYTLSASQKKAIWEILNSFAK